MSALEERIAKTKEKYEYLKLQKRLQDKREKDKQRKLDTRRLIIIGEIFSRYFPDVTRFQPRRTDTENDIEFAPLIDFICTIAHDESYASQLKETTCKRVASDESEV